MESKEDWIIKTAENGKIYYYNKVLKKSVWEKPQILNEDNITEETITKDPTLYNTKTLDNNKDKHLDPKQLKEEKKRKFLNFLKSNNVTYEWKWEKVEDTFSKHEDFKIIEKISDRKKIFKEYSDIEKFKRKREIIQSSKKKKEDFKEMLLEYKNININTKFITLIGIFYKDPRWKAMEEKEREECFIEFTNELFDKEQDNKKLLIEKQCENIRKILITHKSFNSNTTWEEVNELMKDNIIWNDKELHNYYKLDTFKNLIKYLEDIERKQEALDKSERDKTHRIRFHKMIQKDILNDVITIKTKWKKYVNIIKNEEALYNIIDVENHMPHEIFHDYRDKLNEFHLKIKSEFKEILKSNANLLHYNSKTIEKFQHYLQTFDFFKNFKNYLTNSFDYYSNYLFDKYKKRIKKAKLSLFNYLNEINNLNITYEELENSIKKEETKPQTRSYYYSLSTYIIDKILNLFKKGIKNNTTKELRLKLENKLYVKNNYLRKRSYSSYKSDDSYEQGEIKDKKINLKFIN